MKDQNSSIPLPKPLVKPMDQKINMLIYGENGVGKTTFAATAQAHPQMADVLFVDIEGGLLSVTDNSDLPQGHLVVAIENSKQLEELYWALVGRHEDTENPYHSVNTVVFDSGTELQTLRLDEVVAEGVQKNREILKKNTKKEKRDYDEVYQEDFGKNARFLGRWFRAFRDLDVNFIVTAYQRTKMKPRRAGQSRDIDPEPESVGPEFSPKVAQHIKGYMDYVWWMYTYEGEPENPADPIPIIRCALLEPQGIYYAKTRGNLAKRLGRTINWSDLSYPALAWIYDSIVSKETEDAA